jgi:hypothetical protein
MPSVAPAKTPDGVEEDRDRLSHILTYPSSDPDTRMLVDASSAKHTALTDRQSFTCPRWRAGAHTVVCMARHTERSAVCLDVVYHDFPMPGSGDNFFTVGGEPYTPDLKTSANILQRQHGSHLPPRHRRIHIDPVPPSS